MTLRTSLHPYDIGGRASGEFLKAVHWPNSVFKVEDFGRFNKMIVNIEMN